MIHPTAIIGPNVVIGEGTTIGPYAVIGTPAEKHGFWDKPGRVVIGKNCIIREFVTIHGSTGEHPTTMGDDCVMLRGSHAGHDCTIEDRVTISCNVLLGGHSHVMQGANLGLGAIVHQNSVIGSYAMLGMGTIVTKKSMIMPGQKFVGVPAKFIGENTVGLKRNRIEPEDLVKENHRYARLVLK